LNVQAADEKHYLVRQNLIGLDYSRARISDQDRGGYASLTLPCKGDANCSEILTGDQDQNDHWSNLQGVKLHNHFTLYCASGQSARTVLDGLEHLAALYPEPPQVTRR
jgi:hypothetical protein